jgi:hypothetical protein
VYLAKNQSIKANVLLCARGSEAAEKALLDSGATENLIHPRMVSRLGLSKAKLKRGRKLLNVDGTLNQLREVTHATILIIKGGEHLAPHRFLIADIGKDDLILGYPFFEAANPRVDWPTGVLMNQITLMVCQEWDDIVQKLLTKNPQLAPIQVRKVTVAQQLAEAATDKKE